MVADAAADGNEETARVFLAMKHEIELMLRHGGGAVVNTSSGAGVKVSRARPPTPPPSTV